MGLADLHIHTIYSWDGTGSVSAVLKTASDRTDLDVIAITDHDEIRGALEAVELAPAYGIEVIPGVEVSSADGHVLALFVHQPVPAGLSLEETVYQVGLQDGLCVAAHPEARGTSSLSGAALRRALGDADIARVLVGIEAFNAGLFYGNSNLIAEELAGELDTAAVGNSDSHVLWTIGQGASEFSGRTAAHLRRALENHATRVVKGKRLRPMRSISSWMPRYLLRRAGWVAWNSAPQEPLVLARAARVGMRHGRQVAH